MGDYKPSLREVRLVDAVKREGVSYFLQMVILVGLVTVVGAMLYAGATGLFAGWTKNYQLSVTNAYLIGGKLYVALKNTGNVPIQIDAVTIYPYNGSSPLGTTSLNKYLNPGDLLNVEITVSGLKPGQIVEILVTTKEGFAQKFVQTVQ